MKRIPHFVLFLAALPASTFAGGLDRDLVPASTRWIAHLDLERFGRTELLSAAREARLEEEVEWAEVRAELGFDPLEDMLSLTVFASGDTPEEAIAILSLRPEAAERAIERVESEEGHVFLEAQGVKLRAWTDGDSVEAYAFDLRRGTEHLFLVGDDRARLLSAVRVLRGEAASLADVDRAHLAANPDPGSFFYAEASAGLAGLGNLAPVRTVGGLVSGMRFDAGEHEGVLRLSLALDLEQGEDAGDVAQVLRGGVALLALMARQDGPESPCERLVTSLDFRSEGARIVATFSHESRALIRDLRDLERR